MWICKETLEKIWNVWTGKWENALDFRQKERNVMKKFSLAIYFIAHIQRNDEIHASQEMEVLWDG